MNKDAQKQTHYSGLASYDPKLYCIKVLRSLDERGKKAGKTIALLCNAFSYLEDI